MMARKNLITTEPLIYHKDRHKTEKPIMSNTNRIEKHYNPTYARVCEDPDCPRYGEPLIDLGWGYPVCPSQQRYSLVGTPDIPMNPIFINNEQTAQKSG